MPTVDKRQDEVAALRHKLAQAQGEKDLLNRINSSIEIDVLLDIFAEEIERLGFFDAYLINLADEKNENLICVKVHLPEQYRFMERTCKNFHYPFDGDFIHVRAYLKNCTLTVNQEQIKEFTENVQTRFKRWQVRELISTPICAADTNKPIGSIMAYCLNNDIPQQSERELYRLAELFSSQLINAQKYDRLKSKETHVDQVAAEQARLMEFVTCINSLVNREEIFDHVAQGVLNQLPFEHVSLFLEEDNQLCCKINRASRDIYFGVYKDWDAFMERTAFDIDEGDGAISVCFVKNQELLVPDVTKILDLPMARKDQLALKTLSTPRTFYLIPIRLNGNAIGVIRLISFTRVIELQQSDSKFIDLLCRFIGPAIRNAENYELIEARKRKIEGLNSNLQSRVNELAEIATFDKLTGLHNYRSFELEFENTFKPLKPDTPLNLALIFVDIDHFKNFNDSFGHIAGNDVLIGVAEKIKLLTRQLDVACRYGGEEFVVILPRCDLIGAEQFSERLRSTIENSTFETDAGKLSVTVSVGYGCHEKNENKERFFEKVDKALYQAKNNGRNRIERAL